MATSTKPAAKPSSGAGSKSRAALANSGGKPGTRRDAARKASEKGAAASEAAGPYAGAAVGGATYVKERRDAKKARKSRPGPLSKGDPRRLVMTEFLVCMTVLGFGTIVPTPKGRKDEGVGHLVVKGTALSLLFFMLALVASAGGKAEKAAAGLGALVTAAYLFTSEDMYNIMTWVASFYAKPGSPQAGSVQTVAYSGKYVEGPPASALYSTSDQNTPAPTTVQQAAAQTPPAQSNPGTVYA